MPVYTRHLSPADYGIINTLQAVSQLIPIFMSLCLDSAFARFYHDYKNDKEKLIRLFSTVYWFVICWGSIILFCALLFAKFWISNIIEVPFYYITLTFIPCLLMQIGQLGLVFLRQTMDSKRTTFLEVAAALISISITIPLLVTWEMGVTARLIGNVFPSIFLFLYYTLYFTKHGLLTKIFDISLLKYCLLFSVPLLPNILSGWISGMSDRLILSRYVNEEAVGIYSIALTFASLLYIIQDAVTQVTGPYNMSGLVNDRSVALKKLAEMSLILWATMLVADLTLNIFSPEIISIFATKDYKDASKIIGICGFAYVLSSQYRIFMDIVSFHKMTWVISTAGFISAFVSLVLNLWFIPDWGYVACAYIFCTSVLLYTLWIYYWASKCETIKLYWVRMIILFIIFLMASTISSTINEVSMINASIKLVLVLLYSYLSIFFIKFNRNSLE